MSSVATRFILDSFTPAYQMPGLRDALPARVRSAIASLAQCRVCPRRCEVDRLNNRTKFCRTGRHARIHAAFAHHGEEDCLRGRRGSGTIFFACCNLRCVFCQNWDISQKEVGHECTGDEIATHMLRLQAAGCHNINLVTPEHVVPQVVEAIALAIDRGLSIPIIYNTSGYDSIESLRQLEGLVDIYMPDFKLWSPQNCARYLGAKDYAERARDAIREMHRQVGDLRFTRDGLACRGLLVRHLVMPGLLDESTQILQWLAREISPDTYLNIMGQYHPDYLVGKRTQPWRGVDSPRQYAEIERHPSSDELAEAFRLAQDAGLWRFDVRPTN